MHTLVALLISLLCLSSTAHALGGSAFGRHVLGSASGVGGAPVEGDPSLYPGTDWDIDASEDDLNALLAGELADVGTTTKVNVPTLPQGVLAPTTAATAAALAAACNAGGAEVTLTANITGIASIHTARDCQINLDGFTVDVLRLDHLSTADAAQRIHVVGPGKIGFLAKLFGIASASDILIDGVRISIEYMSTPDTTQYPIVLQSGDPDFYGVDRFGLVNSIVRGQSDEDKGAASYFLHCRDVAVVNSNIAGGLCAACSWDDWAVRADSVTRFWVVDSMLKGGTRKPPFRGDDQDSTILYSTSAVRDTDRMLTLLQPDYGDIDPGLDNDGAHDEFGLQVRLFNRWITGNNSGAGTQPAWGPNSGPLFTTAYYFSGGIDVFSESSDWWGASDMAALEAAADEGEVWDMDVLAGSPNSFTFADPVDSLVPDWPTVVSDAAGTVGDDPFVDP
jgi:hypothetical protein